MLSPVKVWRRQKQTKKILGKTGKIIAWTKIYTAGKSFKKFAPYPVVLVNLENNLKAYGQLVDYQESDLNTGQSVVAVLRKVREPSDQGIIAYGVKFKPVNQVIAG